MAVSRAEKVTEQTDLAAVFKAAETAVLVDYRGVTVPQVTELRRQIRAAGASYRVVKNTLAKRAATGTALVSTLAVLESWKTFGRTTNLPRFATEDGRATVAERAERAQESVRLAAHAGVLIAAGTDFGGGSLRANQLAWEVECLVRSGLEPWQALAAATRNGGTLLGEPEAGRIREGGPADFSLVHGDPLSDPSALWRVWRVA